MLLDLAEAFALRCEKPPEATEHVVPVLEDFFVDVPRKHPHKEAN